MSDNLKTLLDADALLAGVKGGLDHRLYGEGETLFSQGEASDKVFYVLEGNVKVGIISKRGKEAVVGIFGPGDFLGELCLSGQQLRISTAIAMNACSVARIAKETMLNLLESDRSFSTLFVEHLLTRNARVEADIVDHLFNSSEKRLARTLLLLANFGKEGQQHPVSAKINQELLAEMVGTTRSRVSHFMNKFRRLGFIEYNGRIEVHSSLFNVLLYEGDGLSYDGDES